MGGRRLRGIRAAGLQVVLYHHLSDHPSEFVDRLRVSTPPELFERHLERLSRDYEVVDLDAVLSGSLPRRALLITFDDGYRSVVDVAGPLLRRSGLPSLFFIGGAFLDETTLPLDNLICWLSHRFSLAAIEGAITRRPTEPTSVADLMRVIADLPYDRRVGLPDELAGAFGVDLAQLRRESRLFLGDSALRGLSDLGMEVGNHTTSHLHCRAILDQTAAQAELIENKQRLEELTDRPVRSFSYPYGSRLDATPYVERVLAASGHAAQFLVESRPNAVRHKGPRWHRVSLRDRSVSRLQVELEVFPRLRAIRDRLR